MLTTKKLMWARRKSKDIVPPGEATGTVECFLCCILAGLDSDWSKKLLSKDLIDRIKNGKSFDDVGFKWNPEDRGYEDHLKN